MVNETELENRTDQQARISEPYGHTAFDRQDNSAFLMVQMRKDIAVVGRAINYALTHMLKLKGIDKILGIKTVTSEFKSSCLALSHLETGCDNILMLLKNKTAMVALEKRYSDWEEIRYRSSPLQNSKDQHFFRKNKNLWMNWMH
jgi:hypothetical protein